MKQTAVEWLVEAFQQTVKLTKEAEGLFLELVERAKDMEKEQLKQLMWDQTHLDERLINKGLIVDNLFDNYWNETFKSVKHNTDIRSMDKLIESNKKFDENNQKGFKYDPNDRSEDTPNITNFFY